MSNKNIDKENQFDNAFLKELRFERQIRELREDIEILLDVIINKYVLDEEDIEYFSEEYSDIINKIGASNILKNAFERKGLK